jgi:hypothetical protein
MGTSGKLGIGLAALLRRVGIQGTRRNEEVIPRPATVQPDYAKGGQYVLGYADLHGQAINRAVAADRADHKRTS